VPVGFQLYIICAYMVWTMLMMTGQSIHLFSARCARRTDPDTSPLGLWCNAVMRGQCIITKLRDPHALPLMQVVSMYAGALERVLAPCFA
jgi:hypothetical protein